MFDIKIDKKAKKPIYAQIRDAIQDAIKEKALKPGDRLPTVAAFAKDIGVTQTTIRRALEDLIKAGYAISHVGRGTFVSDPDTLIKKVTPAKPSDTLYFPVQPDEHEFVSAARQLRAGVAKGLDALMVLTRRPGLIHFTGGSIDPKLMREGTIEYLVKDALKVIQDTIREGQKSYQVYGNPMGMIELREEIAKRYCETGTPITPDHILITSGSQQGVSLMAQYALRNSLRVICETPSYTGIPNAFGAFGHWIETVPRDHEGPLPERLKRFSDGKPSIFYLCPKLHNPLGTDISKEMYNFIINWARDQKATIIANEIYNDLHFDEPPPQSFFTRADAEQTVIIGSLTKSFMFGLGVGWLISSPNMIQVLVPLKRAMDLAGSPLMQGIALALLRTGDYDSHLQKVREYYRPLRDTALEALGNRMPEGIKWSIPQGGFHIWVEMPPGYSSIALFLLAIERGVAIVPGPLLDVDHRFINAFRISYGSLEVDQIQKGIKILAETVKELLKDSPGDFGLSGLGDFQ